MDVINARLYKDEELSLTHMIADTIILKIPSNIHCVLSNLIKIVAAVVMIPFHVIELTALLIIAPFAALITYFRSVFVDKTINFSDELSSYAIKVGFAAIAIFTNFVNDCM
jgi:hypothetical protein